VSNKLEAKDVYHVPKLWKQANVIPVPKIHPPKLVENDLRPISLTATLSKILE